MCALDLPHLFATSWWRKRRGRTTTPGTPGRPPPPGRTPREAGATAPGAAGVPTAEWLARQQLGHQPRIPVYIISRVSARLCVCIPGAKDRISLLIAQLRLKLKLFMSSANTFLLSGGPRVAVLNQHGWYTWPEDPVSKLSVANFRSV
jgi:hypothetical protein